MQLYCAIVLVGILLISSCKSNNRGSYVEELASAKTAADEQLAAISINEKCPPDSFLFLGSDGSVIEPPDATKLSGVHALVLEWDDGLKVVHEIVDSRNIAILIGE
jgi:hypothetical protein